jgi:hypothetical protein
VPDRNGRIPPVAYSLSQQRWDEIFGKKVDPEVAEALDDLKRDAVNAATARLILGK